MGKFMDNVWNAVSNKLKNQSVIEYDLTDSYVLVYDEAYGVAKKRKRLLKNPQTKTHTFFTSTIINLLCTVILNVLCYVYFYNFGYALPVRIICCLIPFLYIILAINIVLFIIRVTVRRRNVKGSIKLNKDGLTDSTFDGIKILFEWSHIKMVICKKNSVIILTDTPIYFFVNKEIEDKLIREIRKYKKDIKVVRN